MVAVCIASDDRAAAAVASLAELERLRPGLLERVRFAAEYDPIRSDRTRDDLWRGHSPDTKTGLSPSSSAVAATSEGPFLDDRCRLNGSDIDTNLNSHSSSDPPAIPPHRRPLLAATKDEWMV